MTTTYELIDISFKGLALAGTAAFFGYKSISGFHNQNLSLSLSCRRVAANEEPDEKDYLILSVHIEKGMTAALTLEALQARFSWGPTDNERTIVPIQIGRLAIQKSDQRNPEIVWNQNDMDRPYLFLAPAEKTTFACEMLIPRKVICKIEVVAVGRRRRSSFQAQWRASTVVPPRSENLNLTETA